MKENVKRAERATARSFGLSVGAVCGVLAVVSGWHGHGIRAGVWGGLAVALLVPAVINPSLLRAPSRVWRRLAQGLGWVNSRVLLSALFAFVLTPMGVALRLGGWDPLRRQRRRQTSGWLPYPERIRDPKHYERMF